MIVGIDSMVIIYAGLAPVIAENRDNPDFVLLKRRAISLIDRILQDNHQLAISTISIAEILQRVPVNQHPSLTQEFAKRFICAEFDIRAAANAAKICRENEQLIESLKSSDRKVVKADAMIIAPIHGVGAKKFYTHDKRCRNMATSLIEALDIPKAETLF